MEVGSRNGIMVEDINCSCSYLARTPDKPKMKTYLLPLLPDTVAPGIQARLLQLLQLWQPLA